MAYERLHWVESETPLSAENMNNIEDGIEELQSQKVDKASGKALSDQNYTAAEKTKLAGIEAGAEVNPGEATTSDAGLMSASDKAKMDGIEAGAEVNLNIFIQDEFVNEDALVLQFDAPFMVSHGAEGALGAITRTETISIPAASASNNGYMSKEDKAKLNGISSKAVHLASETLHPTEQYTIYDGAIEEIITSDCSSSNIIGLAEVEFLNSSGNRIPLAICGYRRSGSHLLINVFNPRNSVATVAKSSRIKVYYWE